MHAPIGKGREGNHAAKESCASLAVAAIPVRRQLDAGVYGSLVELADAENISKSYISRILRMALLAPDLVEAILAGRTDQVHMLDKLARPLPASWTEQRRHLQ